MEFRQYRHLTRPGFTVSELLVTVSITALIAGLGVTALAGARRQAAARTSVARVAAVLRDGQSRALAVRNGSAWAVRCNGSTASLFPYTHVVGLSAQPTEPPVSVTFPDGVRCTGNEARFQKLVGRPTAETVWTVEGPTGTMARLRVTTGGAIETENL